MFSYNNIFFSRITYTGTSLIYLPSSGGEQERGRENSTYLNLFLFLLKYTIVGYLKWK